MENGFKAINNGWAAKKGDIEVGLGGEDQLYYQAGDKLLLFEREDVGDEETHDFGCEVSYPGEKWRWEPPHNHEELTKAEREKVLSDIREAFKALGYQFIFSPIE